MNLTRPSLSFLPMDDIAAELKSDKTNRRFMTREDKASDVENVAGIKAERIAISAEHHDRETVKNALNLNGKPADEYVTQEDGAKFLKVSSDLSEIYSSEIRNLRDELYQLYSELIKRGFLDNTIKYEGFVEGFKRNNILYENFVCGISNAIVGRAKELYIADTSKSHFFEEGKTFVIKRSDTGEEQVVTSLGINDAGKVTFSPAVNFLDAVDRVGLFKTLGCYTNSTFSFSEIEKSVSNANEKYYTQSDDTDTKYLTITEPNVGFAATFKVPRNLNSQLGIAGALSKFAIRAQAINGPGALRCHVVDYNAIIQDGEVNPKFDNIEDAIAKGYCLASSDAVYPTSNCTAMENDIYFDFYGGVHTNYGNGTANAGSIANDEVNFFKGKSIETASANAVSDFATADNYPILKDAKYCFIIECLGATKDSYWRIRFSYFNNNSFVDDLHRRNGSYLYKAVDTSGLTNGEKAIVANENIIRYDLIYTLVVRDVIDEEEVGKQEGVYTTRIILPNPINVSRARLTMRVNREGMYNIKEHNSEYTVFTLEGNTSTSHTPTDTRFSIGEKIIIGNTIATVKRVSTSEIEVEHPVYIDERIIKHYTKTKYDQDSNSYIEETKIPVYRISYAPQIKAKLVDWNSYDTILNKYDEESLSNVPMEFDLVSVVPDKFKSNERISDRLLYEVEFGTNNKDEVLLANEFELQVNWASPFSAKEINEVQDKNDRNFKELIGRIHDLSLAFDKNY